MIAIALACSPELLICDEPTTALDVTIQAQILALIDELKEKTGTSVMMITHDFGVNKAMRLTRGFRRVNMCAVYSAQTKDISR